MSAAFLNTIRNRTLFRLFLLGRLPAAFFAGLRVEAATPESCTVSVPYNRATRNPFRSTYFACLSMAAEMSTGALAMAAVQDGSHPVSLLVVTMEGRFFKKATGKTTFTCTDGLLLQQAVENAIAHGVPQTVKAHSKGVDAAGNIIAEFWFTWSFKAKG